MYSLGEFTDRPSAHSLAHSLPTSELHGGQQGLGLLVFGSGRLAALVTVLTVPGSALSAPNVQMYLIPKSSSR